MGTVIFVVGLAGACREDTGDLAVIMEVTDGDSFHVIFDNKKLQQQYAHLANSEGWIPVRLTGVDYPDFNQNRSMEKCLPGGMDEKSAYCKRWVNAWLLAYATKKLDIPKLKGCYLAGMNELVYDLTNRKVRLIADEQEGDLDSGKTRILRYLQTDSMNLSEHLVTHGYAIYFDPTDEKPCENCAALELAWYEAMADPNSCLWNNQ